MIRVLLIIHSNFNPSTILITSLRSKKQIAIFISSGFLLFARITAFSIILKHEYLHVTNGKIMIFAFSHLSRNIKNWCKSLKGSMRVILIYKPFI